MKRLLLLRHAKSSWDDPALADFDRPLAPRGRKAAPLMGRELAARDWLPQLALVSPAARSRETWELVAAALPGSVSADFPDLLYDATPEDVLSEIRRTIRASKTSPSDLPAQTPRKRLCSSFAKNSRPRRSPALISTANGKSCALAMPGSHIAYGRGTWADGGKGVPADTPGDCRILKLVA
jgi:hypothetical protein